MPTFKKTDTMSLYPLDPRADYSADLNPLVGAEIDLRSEFLQTIYGSTGETPKGRPLLIRRLRRDPLTFARQPCACTDDLTGEPDRDFVCFGCLGTGYYWDEELWTGYKMNVGSETSIARRRFHGAAGKIIDDTVRFYLPYDANILRGDEIIEVALDEEGEIDRPMRRTVKWMPNTIDVKRLDNGRIEYFIISCSQNNAIYIEKEELSFIENP